MTISPGPDGPAITLAGVTKRYGTRTVVSDVSLAIPAGETFALLGPNGAGKSTTVGMLTGTVRPSAGHTSVLGTDPLRATRAWKSRVGVVRQKTGEPGPYTVAELVGHFAALYPNPRSPEEVIAAVGLGSHAGSRVGKLSGGQQRRVDVALGIIGSPEVLFLDEPTTGFDPAARHEFWGLIESLQAEGTTILLTTHYLEEAARLAHRAGVISGGELVAVDTIDGLGGPEARTPVVSWRDEGGVRRRERTHAPSAFVAELLAETGGEPAELTVVRPTLEDIYLDLIAEGADADTDTDADTETDAAAAGTTTNTTTTNTAAHPTATRAEEPAA